MTAELSRKAFQTHKKEVVPIIHGPVIHDKLSKGSETTAADAQAYDALEKSFEHVLQQLAPDPGLEQFRTEYEQVLRAVRRSHDNEKRLGAKCKRLNEELAGASARVTAALRLSEEDQTTIAALRKELEKTWRQIDATRDKEIKLKQQLEEARTELDELGRQAEASKEHDAAMDDLLKHKQDLMQERETQVNQMLSLRQEAAQLRQQLQGVESQRDKAEASLEALRSETIAKRAANEKDQKKRERMEKEMRELKSSLDARQVELQNRAAEAQAAENVLRDYEQQIRENQVMSNRVNKEYNELVNQGNRMQRELDMLTDANVRLTADCSARTASLKAADAALAAARTENARLARAADSAAAHLQASEQKRSQLEVTRGQLKAKAATLEREREALQRSLALQESKIASMVHEQDVLTKMRVQAEATTHRQLDLSKVHEGHQRRLEAEIAALHHAAEQAALEQAALERENQALALQAHALQGKLDDTQDQLLVRNKEMAEVQAEIEAREAVVVSQQKSYEAVRSERNRYSRDLIAAQAEVAEARRKFQRVNQQVELLREDVRHKEAALMKEHFAHSKAEAERQTLASEVAEVEKAVAGSESSAKAQRAELHRLNAIVVEADQERARQRREYEAIMAERDVLGTQLVRRNDEVALLYAKLRLQASALQAGQLAYRDRLAEQRLLRTRIATLQRELTAARRQGAAVRELKRQLGALDKRLLQERVKAKALSEELETPLNVHRWRKLEGSDPTAFELIQKVHLLQRRLIEKAEQMVERDLQIREKEQLCHQLQALTQSMPGPEAAAQLAEAQALYREKVKQLKAVKGELEMRHAQVDDYKLSIRRMEAEITALKGHFFLEKKVYMDTMRNGSADISASSTGTIIEEV